MKIQLSKKQKIAAGLLAVAIVAAVAAFLLFGRGEDLLATTIRLMRYEGEVSLENEGKNMTLREDMMLRNGNVLSTQAASYADLNLDDTKAVGLDEESSADFNQEDQQLRVNLATGGLYFYTTKKLEDGESFDIQSQTLMVGIRGTSGYRGLRWSRRCSAGCAPGP